MEPHDYVTAALATAALIISAVALFRTSKFQQAQLQLQRRTAELADRQSRKLAEEEAEKAQADIRLSLTRERLYIDNVGHAAARDLSLSFEGEDDPTIGNDVDSKLPAPVLEPGARLALVVSLHLTSPSAFNVTVRWTDGDGTYREKKVHLTRN